MFGIIKWGLWQRKWFFVWWAIAIASFISLNLAFYPTFKKQQAQLEQSLSQIPESAKALFSDTGEFASPTGFLSSQVLYFMLPMLLGIFAISLGSSLIAREEKEGTIELLLSRPISRGKLLLGKAVVGIVLLGGAGLVAVATTVVLAKLVDLPISSTNISLSVGVCTLLALSFGAIAYMLTAIGKMRGASIGIATLIALGGYIIASLISMASWLKWPSKLMPFYYYHPSEILEGKYNWNNLLFILGVIVLSSMVSYIAFRRRDIA